MIGQRARAAVVLVFVFAAGAFAGIFVERHHASPSIAPLTAAQGHAAAMAELRHKLELDQRQVEQIDAIMAEHQRIVDLHWEQMRPEVQTTMRQVHEEIVAILHPEQREMFDRWVRERFHGHHHP